MDILPRDYRGPQPEVKRQKGGKHQAPPETNWHTIDVSGGRLGAATLVEYNGRLDWAFLKTRSQPPKIGERQYRVNAFPETSPPSADMPSLSATRMAQTAVEWTRQVNPDLDIPSGLVLEEYLELEKTENDMGKDPVRGNCLVDIVAPDEFGGDETRFLIFPMGVTGSGLNISPLLREDEGAYSTLPVVKSPIKSFATPILQVESYPSMLPAVPGAVNLIVRDYAAVELLSVTTDSGSSDRSTQRRAKVLSAGRLESDNTGERAIVSCSLGRGDSQVLVSNDQGGVYRAAITEGVVTSLYVGNALIDERDVVDLWDIQWCPDGNTAILASSRALYGIDIRDTTVAENWNPLPSDGILTSLEASYTETFISVVTTQKILWFDRRNMSTPVLSLRHHRMYDRTLCGSTITFGDDRLTFLHSEKSDVVTLYDLERSQTHGLPAIHPPRLLHQGFGGNYPHFRRIGFRAIPLTDVAFGVFELSERFGLYMSEYTYSRADTKSQAVIDLESNTTIDRMRREAEEMRPDFGPMGKRRCTTEDLRDIYEDVYSSSTPQSKVTVDDIYELLERMPRFQEESEVPLNHVLTTFDIAQLCGDVDDDESARADFFRTNPLDNPPGRYAVDDERLPLEKINTATAWNADYSKALSELDPNFPKDIDDAEDHFAQFHAQFPKEKVIPSSVLKMQTEACSSLALDMRLSSHAVAPNSLNWDAIPMANNQDPVTTALEAQARALTLRPAEPEDVNFSTIQPYRKRVEEDDDDEEEKPLIPLVGKLLLSEWTLGEDPAEYSYVDPYAAEDDAGRPTQTEVGTQRTIRQSQKSVPAPNFQPFTSTQPPAILTSSAIPPVIQSSQQVGGMSQDARTLATPFPATQFSMGMGMTQFTQRFQSSQMSSQDAMVVSTQQLPGKFGGRPTGKKVKKRLPGF